MVPVISSMSLPFSAYGDLHNYIDYTADFGGNCIRFFGDYLDGDLTYPNPMTPFMRIGTWNPYALAGEPGYPDVPIYDLAVLYPPYWDRLKDIFEHMKLRGIIPWFVFEDRCSEADGGVYRFNQCFYSNVQRYPDWNVPGAYAGGVEAAIPGGSIGLGLNDYHYHYELRVIDLWYSLGMVTIFGEPRNEIGYRVSNPETGEIECPLEDQLEWIRLRCSALHNLKYTKTIVSTRDPITGPDVLALMDNAGGPAADLWDQHAIGEAADIATHPNGWPVNRVIWNTDGAWNGEGPGMSFAGKHDVSPEQMAGLRKEILSQGAAGGCYLSQGQIFSGTDPWDMGLIDQRPLGALSGYAVDQVLSVNNGTIGHRSESPSLERPKPCLEYLQEGNLIKWWRCVK